MILDIDIRVSNDNGIQVHQFTKHFDSRFEGNKIEGNPHSISKSFEDFLSEFLSGSGRLIREQLITPKTTSYDAFHPVSDSYNNIEYTLKLGDSQSVSGKIPLDKLFRLNEMAKFTSNASSDETLPVSADETVVLKRIPFKPSIDLSEVDSMFQHIITTAVSKYEDSFFLKNLEPSNFIESS